MAGMTVAEMLDAEGFSDCRVLAGQRGLGRTITRVTVAEVPDYQGFVHDGEFVLSTGYAIRDNPAAQREFVAYLAPRVAALGVKRRWFREIFSDVLVLADNLAFPVIELPAEIPWSTLLADIARLLLDAELQAGQARIADVLSHGGTAAEMVRFLSSFAGRPTCLVDEVGRLIIGPYGGERPAPNTSVSAPVLVGGRLVGSLIMARPADRSIMDQAARLLSIFLARERGARLEQRAFHRWFQTWLGGLVETAHQLQEQASLFGYELASAYTPVVLRMEGGGSLRRAVADFLNLYFCSPQTGDLAGPTPQGVVFLTARADVRARCDDLLAAVSNRWPVARPLAIVVGRTCPPAAVPSVYKEAIRDLDACTTFDRVEGVIDQRRVPLYRLLIRLRDTPELDRFLDASLSPLLKYDEQHGTALANTLETYLHTGRNIKETAQAANLHYNTVRYRLKRIQRLTGRLLDDPAQCTELELAVLLRRLRLPGER